MIRDLMIGGASVAFVAVESATPVYAASVRPAVGKPLQEAMASRGKIRASRVTGNCVQHQRDIAIAVKNAREVALLPFSSSTR